MPLEYLRWIIAERYGWTLQEVDSLSLEDIEQFFAVDDARQKASQKG